MGFALLAALGEGAPFCVVKVDGLRTGEAPDPMRAIRPLEGDGATLGTVLVDAAVADARRAGLVPSLEPTLVAAAGLTAPESVPDFTFFCEFYCQRLGRNTKAYIVSPVQPSSLPDTHSH